MDGYQQGTEKFAPRYDKCLSCGGDCVEKWLDCGTVTRELFLLDFKVKKPKYAKYNIFLPTSITHVVTQMLESVKQNHNEEIKRKHRLQHKSALTTAYSRNRYEAVTFTRRPASWLELRRFIEQTVEPSATIAASFPLCMSVGRTFKNRAEYT
jgi:hypothetical protein